SNSFGDFVIELPNENPQRTQNLPFHFFHHLVLWEDGSTIQVQLSSLEGKIVSNIESNSGRYLLPNLDFGIYVLQIVHQGDRYAFKVFSDGIQTFFAEVAETQARYQKSPRQLSVDTLSIKAEGYYPRDIIIYPQDTVLRISMLRGDYEELHFLNELIDPLAYEILSSSPARSNVGGIRAVKIIYNSNDGLMYYMNTKLYQYHSQFAAIQLGFRQGNAIFNLTQYQDNPDRYLYPANLNYYPKLDKYVLQLVAINEMSCENLKILYDKLIETSFFGDKLVFFSNKEIWDDCAGVPLISSEELYQGQVYQALNLEENYGYLTKVSIDDLADTYLGRRDIVMLNSIPNEVSVVAGIITTEFQTPLSHINVLSNSRGTPNMALRNGWDSPQLDSLLGDLVYLKVEADSFILRRAGLAEAEAFWAQKEPQTVSVLPKNIQPIGLVDLQQANHQWVDRIGGKAANFAELLKIQSEGLSVPVPENSFAIPFHYYDQHLKSAGLDMYVEEMLQDSLFISDPAIRKQRLEQLRDSIREAPIDPVLVGIVRNWINDFADFPAFRFRSSTNAEDLGFFSGAGLYDSYSAKQDHDSKTIENAIRKVWASLWNWRAFEERSYFKIDHRSCAMGILVHRSFPDEDANGVLITRNLYNENPGFIINVQYQEYSIVFPEPGILHDQIMLFAWSLNPEQNFTPEYLTLSNIPELNGQRVMSDAELHE
ncbi:MAG: PEP/pyruvate-binding domain-containing protein, partial [Bacteroidota bacterium]